MFDEYEELKDDPVDDRDPLSILIEAEEADEYQSPIINQEVTPMKTSKVNLDSLAALIIEPTEDAPATPSTKPNWFELKEGRSFDKLSDYQILQGCAKAVRKVLRHDEIAKNRLARLEDKLNGLELSQEAGTFKSTAFVQSLTAAGIELTQPKTSKTIVKVNPDGWQIEEIKESIEDQMLELEAVRARCVDLATEIKAWVEGREMKVDVGTKSAPDPLTGLPVHKAVSRKAEWADVIMAARDQQAFVDNLRR